MRRMRVGVVLVLALVVVAGCSTMKKWERVSLGMDHCQVQKVMGDPERMDAGDTGAGIKGVWTYYDPMRETRYEIVFDNGKVTEKHAQSCRGW